MAKIDVYDIVTEKILAELEKGIIPWHKPWIQPTVSAKRIRVSIDPTKAAYSRSTGKVYSLLNQMLLGKAGEWATFQQIIAAGGTVKKGEKSSVCVFWKFIPTKTGKLKPDGTEETRDIPCLRYYNVFHIESQCEGIEPRKRGAHEDVTVTTMGDSDKFHWDAVEQAAKVAMGYLSRSGVIYSEQEGGDRAYYSPVNNSITTPCRGQFKRPEEYYATLFHEMTHSTGHKTRLDRFTAVDQFHFGSASYSKEELVAELGAAALNNLVGIESDHSLKNSAAYIQSWSRALRDDHKLIVAASSKAEKAVNYILGDE